MNVSFVIGSTIALWWSAGCVALIVASSRRIAEYEQASRESAGLFCGVVPLGYAIYAPLSWPLAAVTSFVVGAAMLRRPELARQGRITLLYGAVGNSLLLWAWALGTFR